MAMTNAQRVKKSREKNDCIVIRPELAKGAEIRKAAAKAREPMTVYILKAIEARMKSEKEE